MSAASTARNGILRAVLVTAWLISAAVYVLAMSGALSPIWSIMTGMESVTNGPFWDTAQRFKTIATFLVPALLFLGPVVYWLVGGVLFESNTRRRRI